MNYPNGTIVQNYSVNAGRVIQMPCLSDQSEPPDDFRAIVFATPEIGVDSTYPLPNQIGPAYSAGKYGAIQFDLTQLIQQNALSNARSIIVNTNASTTTAVTGNAFLALDSGLLVPSGCSANILGGSICVDFVSANPIFALLVNNTGMAAGLIWDFTVAVTNFKASLHGFGSGA